MGYRINVDFAAIKNKIDNPALRLYAHERLKIYCDKYVPYRSGHLSKDARATEQGVHYIAPYAVYCYFGNFNFRKDQHPDATSHWDKVMLLNQGDSYFNELKEYIIQRL